jgi:hypothetical protein
MKSGARTRNSAVEMEKKMVSVRKSPRLGPQMERRARWLTKALKSSCFR